MSRSPSHGFGEEADRCLRCERAAAMGGTGVCSYCRSQLAFDAEVGVAQLELYLGKQADFAVWLAAHEGPHN